ncbi:MAG: hypothetical protein CFE21_10290 [Bacteroidetes bacterium B1(2017)]|nr:MAG: hypothetical protein CFE21_10290 [Bacteroidetes bacterium B1(2017)]
MITPKNLLFSCLFIVLFMHGSLLKSQPIKERYFGQIGFSLFSDFFNSKITPIEGKFNFTEYSRVEGKGYARYNTFNWFTISYTARINAYQFSKNASLSIESPMAFGLSLGQRELYLNSMDSVIEDPDFPNSKTMRTITERCSTMVKLSVPLFINFNYGLGSTLGSDLNKGISIGLGVDNATPIFLTQKDLDIVNGSDKKIPSIYFMPAVTIGYRFWTQTVAREINLKVGYLPSHVSQEVINSIPGTGPINGLSVRLSYNKFLNF